EDSTRGYPPVALLRRIAPGGVFGTRGQSARNRKCFSGRSRAESSQTGGELLLLVLAVTGFARTVELVQRRLGGGAVLLAGGVLQRPDVGEVGAGELVPRFAVALGRRVLIQRGPQLAQLLDVLLQVGPGGRAGLEVAADLRQQRRATHVGPLHDVLDTRVGRRGARQDGEGQQGGEASDPLHVECSFLEDSPDRPPGAQSVPQRRRARQGGHAGGGGR